MATQSESQEYEDGVEWPGGYVPDSTLEADVVKTIELEGAELGRFNRATISTTGADIWVTTGQRAPRWAIGSGPRARNLPADPGPDVPGAQLVTSARPVTVSWLTDAFNPTVKLWSAGTPGYSIVRSGVPMYEGRGW